MIVIIGYLSLKKTETVFYIGIANPSKRVDVHIEFEGEDIFKGDLEYNPIKYVVVRKEFSSGFKEVIIKSERADLTKSDKVFLPFNRHVVIEYFPESLEDGSADFSIRSSFSPFYLE